jgi:hypothetical protein
MMLTGLAAGFATGFAAELETGLVVHSSAIPVGLPLVRDPRRRGLWHLSFVDWVSSTKGSPGASAQL